MRYLLGIDFGGGASKATLLCEDGTVAASASVEYPTSYPGPGRAEQDPADWYEAVKKNIASVLKESGASSSDMEAVCLDAATHTAVLMDNDFNVVRPSIYWTDSRSIEESRRLREEYGSLVFEQTLHNADTIWTLPQLMWVRQNEPDIWRRIKKILFAKDYIRHLLTGDYFTDYIEAQGSMFFDCNKM
ncbi:MAG: FGGY family carbohydrate kinase, partial [Eubacteriales bacterium]|nr:FGGY family carbohydrate kinase [Eubacteriales bacterium]